MESDIILAVPTYKRFDLLALLISSVEKGSVKPFRYLVFDNSGGDLEKWLKDNEPWILELDNLHILVPGENLGVAAAWNIMLEKSYEKYPEKYVLTANDDLVFYEETLGKFSDSLDDCTPDSPVLCSSGIDSVNAFSLFLTRWDILCGKVGPFDCTYFAYYEDNDLKYRMDLLDIDLFLVPDTRVQHMEGGSATLKSFTVEERREHDRRFDRNTVLYIEKWGGLPGREVYKAPFNGRNMMIIMQLIHKRFGF